MPRKSATPCRYAGCTEKVRGGSGYCPAHGGEIARTNKLRYPEHAHYSTTSWRKTRKAKLARDRFCECRGDCGDHLGCCHGALIASEVDHIVERRDGGGDEDSNLRSVCSSCHRRKTHLERRRRKERARR